jgi:hypothetical protein
MKAIALLLLLSLLPTFAVADANECKVGEPCTVEGVLRIFRTPPAPMGILEVESTCIPLALPDDVLADPKWWRNTPVTIVGFTHSHHGGDVADGVLSYLLEGRNVIGSLCNASPVVLFVTEIKETP